MGVWVNKSILDKFWKKVDAVFTRKTATEQVANAAAALVTDLRGGYNGTVKTISDDLSSLTSKEKQDIENLSSQTQADIADAVADTLYEVSEHLIPRYSNVPTALHLDYQDEISIKNKANLYIGANITPAPELQNIVFQKKSGSSLNIHPTTGKLEIVELGESFFYIYPTFNTQICKEVSINVRKPKVVINGSIVRLVGTNIRIV